VELVEDAWLSERFGRPVLSVQDLADAADAAELRRDLTARAPASCQARVPCDRVDLVRAHAEAGLFAANVVVTLARRPEFALPGSEEDVDVGVAEPSDDGPILLEIAERSFRFTRFHLDPEVPDVVADRIKRDWVESYLRGARGERLLVARRGGRPLGFLCVMVSERDGDPVEVIDLIGVDPAARRSGAGRALVSRFLADAGGRRRTAEVGTQAANTLATSFYESLGFSAVRAHYDLHGHFGAWA
jgi:ribosomal protein S18 acetylase RimI-like enzyme